MKGYDYFQYSSFFSFWQEKERIWPVMERFWSAHQLNWNRASGRNVRCRRMIHERNRPYRAFVLRCWQGGQETANGHGEWRYMVEEVLGGEYRRASTSLGILVAHLKMELERGACERSDSSK